MSLHTSNSLENLYLHAVCSSEHPAGLDEDASTDVAEGPRGAFGSGLKGNLPRMSSGKRFLPSEDPGRAAGLWLPTLGELGGGDVWLGWSWNCLWGGWSWQEREIKTEQMKIVKARISLFVCVCVCVCVLPPEHFLTLQ